MQTTDTPVPPASGTLLARMTALARLVERIGAREPSGILLDRSCGACCCFRA